MKRRDVMKQIAEYASQTGQQMTSREGGRHTVVYVGDRRTTVPRHGEINEITAKQILKQIGAMK